VTAADYTHCLLTTWDHLRGVGPAHRRPTTDRAIAHQLWIDGTPLETVFAAMRLALHRLAARPANLPPLPPPRSLAYLLPILNELRGADPAYLKYLLGDCPDFSAFK
jgi:hypothetical protein